MVQSNIFPGMPQRLVEQAANHLPPRFGGTSPNDVFLMVKGFVSDVELSQEVLVVWPGREANASMTALRRIASNQVPGAGWMVSKFMENVENNKSDSQELQLTWMTSARKFYLKLPSIWRTTMITTPGASCIWGNLLVNMHYLVWHHPGFNFCWWILQEYSVVQ